MEILIEVKTDDGETLYRDTTSSFEIAEMILDKAKRYIEREEAKALSRLEEKEL